MYKEFDELKNSGQLPSPSGVGLRILCLTQEDDWAVDDLANLIQTDPALTGRILKLANSVASGAGEPISTVQEASVRIGIRAVSNLALGFTLVTGNRHGRCEAFDYEAFWTSSLARGVACELLSRTLRLSSPAEAFTCGLLSRIGELALASVHPTGYAEVLESVRAGGSKSLRMLENEKFSIDSREVSMAMLTEWGLPESFVKAIGFFDELDGGEFTDNSRERDLGTVLRLASIMGAFCCADAQEQVAQWPDMEAVRSEVDMSAKEFGSFCEELSTALSTWGQTLEIPTIALPSVGHVERLSSRALLHAAEQASEADVDEADQFQKLRVLAVDDEPLSLKLLKTHVEKAGHEVVTATNGKEALALTLQWNPHIVISDWMMPEMDGLELCHALRAAHHAGRGVYFLLVTGRDEEDKVVEAFEAGIDDYITKPFKPKILLARIRAGLRLVNLREQVDREQKRQSEATAKLAVMTRKLREAATTDVLTGVPNRRYAMQRLQEEWELWSRNGQTFSVVMADIDHFKRVNDTYGHDVGDVVLQKVAETMRDTVRGMDKLARIGGEEFLAICPDTDLRGAQDCAERLRKAVAQTHIEAGGFSGSVTLSIGVASTRPGMEHVDEALKDADEAVYEAKRGGRDQVRVTSDAQRLPKSA